MKLDRVQDVLPYVLKARRLGNGLVIATLVADETGIGARIGARLIMSDDQSAEGGISPQIDSLLLEDGLGALRSRRSAYRSYEMGDDGPRRVRTGSGQIDVFFQVLARPHQLIIVGAGHIAQPLSNMAAGLGMTVTVVDDRAEFATAERFPSANRITVGPYAEALSQVSLDLDTFVVLVTRGHTHDQACLELVLGSNARYIGMIGSKRRVRTVLNRLESLGYDPTLLKSVYAPVGLAIGAETPAEIATSILAEIVAVARNAPPIHWSARGPLGSE